ncbi:MAG: hypothetical protein LBI48_07400 [Burkholderiaceae bacterium]|jgi:hypothetical protein|nr:hypothetical protein [Burkholderiaceae bacterium]
MNIRAAMAFVVLLLTASAVWAAGNMGTEEDNRVLALVVKQSYKDGGYTVVNPETGLSHFFYHDADADEIRRSKQYIAKNLQTNGIVVTELVDRLFERNKKPVRLTLKSSPQDGYVMNFDSEYAKYFKDNGGGWEKWYKENPKAHGRTTVSLPVYDQKTGLLLVYMGTQWHWLAGEGWVILYKYEKGKLKEINKVMMWIS